ncbi:MAG: ABC transporter permease, partial [Acidimicrobiia bacterium]
MWAMILKEVRQVRRDRRTLAMMIVMPIMLLVVFGYAASFDVSKIEVSFPEGAPTQATALPDILEVVSTTRSDPVDILRFDEADVVISSSGTGLVAAIDGSELFNARAAVQVLTAAAGQGVPVTTEVLFNPELDTSAVLVPGLAGLVLLFVGSLITSLGVVRERQAGTLEQLAVMPLRPRDVFVGKITPYFVVAAVDMVIVLVVGWLLFDVPFVGSIWLLALGALLFLFVTLGTG